MSSPAAPAVVDRRAFLATTAMLVAAACAGDTRTAPSPTTSAGRRALPVRGVNYDVGTRFAGALSRTSWEPAYVRRELSTVRHELGANAVQLVGTDVDRLLEAAEAAIDAGLAIWLEPRPFDQPAGDAVELFRTVAVAAQQRRDSGVDVTMSLGVEHTIFLDGLVPGADFWERATNLERADPLVVDRRLDDVLRDAAAAVRAEFDGPVTYAAGAWENVDWSRFDLVGVNLYRDSTNAATYPRHVRALHRHGRPVVITEFGCCSYVGAAERGGTGFMIVDWTGPQPILRGPPVRDEDVQAGYLDELLDVFVANRVHGAFVWDFIEPDSPYSPDPAHDLDMAGFAIVRCDGPGSPDDYATTGRWTPKKAFETVARRFQP
jgi:hypothetical protein